MYLNTASAMESKLLEKRQYGYGYGYGYGNYSAWNAWARWLVLGLVVGGAILLFLAFACISSRRRRRQGNVPLRGTGWALGPKPQRENTHYPNTQQTQPYYNNSNNPAPPPVYGAATSYYAKDAGVQQPQPVYGAQPVYGNYAPPQGPPPERNY